MRHTLVAHSYFRDRTSVLSRQLNRTLALPPAKVAHGLGGGLQDP